MGGLLQPLISRLLGVIRKPGFWIIVLLFLVISLPHYHETFSYPSFLTYVIPTVGLTRHALERILFLIPVVWSGFLFGIRGTVIASLVALGCMLPRALLLSEHQSDAIFETVGVFIIGGSISGLLAFSTSLLRRERQYLSELEATHREMEHQVIVIKEDEKRLAALNQISNAVSMFLELEQVLSSAIDNVVNVMNVDAAWIFLLKKEGYELEVAAYNGISEEVASGIDYLKVGEGLSGRVAESGETLFIEDAATDYRLTREVVSKDNIHSMLIVQMSSKGKANGTLSVAMRSYRLFQPEERELLEAIGNQVGVAVENARLYQEQQNITEQIRKMEENLHFYLYQATKAQEEERKRISRELHDDTIQSLVVLSRQIDNLASSSDNISEDERSRLVNLQKQAGDIMKGVRRLSQDLRPAAIDRLGLLPALEWLVSDIMDYSGIEIKINTIGDTRRFTEEVELVLFRVIQEALRNIWRHSQATRAEISIEFNQNNVNITIRDNGKGFNPPSSMGDLAKDGKLGLAGMFERARLIGGTLQVESHPSKGTTVTVEVSE